MGTSITSYPVCEDVKAMFTMIRDDRLEIILDTVITRWEADIDGITGSLPASLPRRPRYLGGMIHTDQEITMVQL